MLRSALKLIPVKPMKSEKVSVIYSTHPSMMSGADAKTTKEMIARDQGV
jgi:hypothetical protein